MVGHMSTPIDEFDLDVRIGEPSDFAGPQAFSLLTNSEACVDSHCATCGSACCRPRTESCF
jgi:hypothetical protein